MIKVDGAWIDCRLKYQHAGQVNGIEAMRQAYRSVRDMQKPFLKGILCSTLESKQNSNGNK